MYDNFSFVNENINYKIDFYIILQRLSNIITLTLRQSNMSAMFITATPEMNIFENNDKISLTFKEAPSKHKMNLYYNTKNNIKFNNKFMRKNHSLKQPWQGKSKY